MKNIKQLWLRFSQLFSVAKVLHGVFVALPAVVATGTAMYAMAENVPRSQLFTMAVVALAATVLFLNQFRMLLGYPISVKSPENFEHGLSYVGLFIGYAPKNQSAALQIGVLLSNSSRAAIRYRVKNMLVVAGTTTLPFKNYINDGGVIPLMSQRRFSDSPYPLAQIQAMIGETQTGVVDMEIVYGPANDEPVRVMKFKLAITIELTDDSARIMDVILNESDEALP